MKEYYVKLLKDTVEKFRGKINDAPIKGYKNHIMNAWVPSQWDVMKARDNAIKDIVNEAKHIYGIDLGVKLKEDEVYESPYAEESGE